MDLASVLAGARSAAVVTYICRTDWNGRGAKCRADININPSDYTVYIDVEMDKLEVLGGLFELSSASQDPDGCSAQ